MTEHEKLEVNGEKKHLGTCHCGAVKFEAVVDLGKGVSRCNCTVCTKTAWLGAIVKPEAFTVLEGAENLTMYEWGFKTGKRYFCKICSVMCYGAGHLKEMGGDYVSINVNCIDDVELRDLSVLYFDGRHNNWHAGTRPEPWPIFD